MLLVAGSRSQTSVEGPFSKSSLPPTVIGCSRFDLNKKLGYNKFCWAPDAIGRICFYAILKCSTKTFQPNNVSGAVEECKIFCVRPILITFKQKGLKTNKWHTRIPDDPPKSFLKCLLPTIVSTMIDSNNHLMITEWQSGKSTILYPITG